MKDNEALEDPVKRAALPEIMFADDVALALGIHRVRAGLEIWKCAFGPFFRVGGRVAVLRDVFLESMASAGSGDEVLRGPDGS